MSLLGETQSDRELPRARREDIHVTYNDLAGILESTRMNRLSEDEMRSMKVKRARDILGDANRFKDMGHEGRFRTFAIMGFAIEASQSTNPKDKEAAVRDLVGMRFISGDEAAELVGFIGEVDKVRNRRAADEEYRVNSGPLGGHVMEILAQGERYARQGEELALALKTAAAWSMEDPAFASDVYEGISRDFSEE